MLTTLGKRRAGEPTLLERFTDCHGRIRSFCALARRLAQASGDDARAAARELQRYFSIGLPLHVADEEQSLAPRLVPLDAAVGEALDEMARDHADADQVLASLLTKWEAVAADPSAPRCAATGDEAAWIDAHFARHLQLEETRVLPLVARLAPAEAQAIVAEMRARRATSS